MKEYIKVDNQILAIVLLLVLAFVPLTQHKYKELMKDQAKFLKSDMGRFGVNDLV